MAWRIKGLSAMNGNNIVLDTCAVIKLLDRQFDLPSIGINVDEALLFSSVIVRIELLSKRSMQDDEEKCLRTFLDDLTIVPINAEIEKAAIEIRRAVPLKLPDCIVAATSVILEAVLLTDDERLLNLSWPGFRTKSIF